MELRCSCGTPSHSLPRGVFEKTPLGTPKNFFKCVKAKPDCLSVFRERDFVPPERAHPADWLALSFCGTPSHSLPRGVFEKTPLGTPKNFFKCVKAKPDCLSVFRERDFVPPERAHPADWLALSFCGTLSHTLPRVRF